MSAFDTPRFLYMMAATTETVIIGAPIAKYRVGTHRSGNALLADMARGVVAAALPNGSPSLLGPSAPLPDERARGAHLHADRRWIGERERCYGMTAGLQRLHRPFMHRRWPL